MTAGRASSYALSRADFDAAQYLQTHGYPAGDAGADTLTPADLIPHNNAVDADEDADIDDHH